MDERFASWMLGTVDVLRDGKTKGFLTVFTLEGS